jgi:hypothetical protein
MKTSFSAAVAAPAPTASPEATTTQAIVPATESAPALYNAGNPTDDLAGEIGRSDVRLPRLNLVARTGDLAELFDPGSYVLNKEIKLSKGGEELLTLVVLRLRKQYQEALPFGDPETPRVFETAEEVRANGGTVSYGKGPGIFAEIAHLELLIRKPESLPTEAEPQFFFESEGHLWTHCVFTVGGTAYGQVAKPIISARMNHLRDTGLVGGLWTLGSFLKKANGNAWFTPVLKTAGKTSDQFRQDVASSL